MSPSLSLGRSRLFAHPRAYEAGQRWAYPGAAMPLTFGGLGAVGPHRGSEVGGVSF